MKPLLFRCRYSVRVQFGRRRDGSDSAGVGRDRDRLLAGADVEERSFERFFLVPVVDEVRLWPIRLCRVVLPAVYLSVYR